MLNARFYDTYYFCNIIKNILSCPDDYLGTLNEFYGDGAIYYKISGFKKYSTLHEFIEFIVENVYYDQINEQLLRRSKRLTKNLEDLPILLEQLKPNSLPIERALEHHEIKHTTFELFLENQQKNFYDCNIDDAYEYIHKLREEGAFDQLTDHITKEIFHVLYQNRDLMKTFNIMMANALSSTCNSPPPIEVGELFSKPGVLKRTAIPKWVRRAAFYRDQGRCVLCDKDLSGTINLENLENYDHIVPLARHGLNDISNIQLLCMECNQIEKRAGEAITSNKYQSWYKY